MGPRPTWPCLSHPLGVASTVFDPLRSVRFSSRAGAGDWDWDLWQPTHAPTGGLLKRIQLAISPCSNPAYGILEAWSLDARCPYRSIHI